ncbi:MAG: extracellular solute-binding protein [bacterium]|jgi:maltose-binding protein MalE|nr:extracellular solute-binding protein [candidate division KSB1 bacterium]MDH7560478.1 extracellular solute-binding protein [bacterium]
MRKLLLAILVGLVLPGCSRNERRIMVWTSLRPVERQVLAAQLAKFAERHPGWQFGQLFYGPEECRTNFIISALGGSGPALLHGASDNVGPLVELGVIQPIEPHVSQAFLDSFLTTPIVANTWYRGHLYQVADRLGNHLCLVYNKKIVKRAPRTISELIEFGKNFCRDENGDGKPDRYALAWNYTEPFFVVPFIGGYGGWIMDEQNRPTLDTPAVVKAGRLIYELAHVHKIIPVECDYEIANALFKDGIAAMIINGPWSWGTYIESGIDIGLARIPMIDETGLWPTPMVSPLGYSLNANLRGERLRVAVELLRFLTSTEVELEFTRIASTIPSRVDAYEHPVVRDNELLQRSIDQLVVGRPMPVVTELRMIWDAMRPSYQGLFTGAVSPERAAKDMQQMALRLIRESRD